MKIINRTRWRTDQIKAIAMAVAEVEFDANDRKKIVIEVKYGAKRSGGIGGRAYLGHSSSRPSKKSWIIVNQPEFYARLCRHCRGTKQWHTMIEQHERDSGANKVVTHSFEAMEQRLDPVDLAYTIAHEFQHNKGRNHRDMHPRYMGKQPEYFAWAKEYVIEPEQAAEKRKATPDERAEKALAHAERMLKQAATRLKRAITIAEKWQHKVERLEKKMAASPRQATTSKQ